VAASVVAAGGASAGAGGDAAGNLRPSVGCRLVRARWRRRQRSAFDSGQVGLLLQRSYPSLIRWCLHVVWLMFWGLRMVVVCCLQQAGSEGTAGRTE
jgi:hypothetical protein